MPNLNEPTPEDMITKPLLAAGFLIEEASPELAMPVDPSRGTLEARIAMVEQATEQLDAIAKAARTMLRLVQP